MFLPTICGLLIAFVLFYLFRHNVDRILRCIENIKPHILQLTCWVCHRSQDLDAQVAVLNDQIENFKETNIELKKTTSQLIAHIQHMNDRIGYITKEIEKCD